jgi:hypothetical protein
MMSFVDAIRNTSEISECLRAGLQALGSNSTKIRVVSTNNLKGSVDIDSCVKYVYPTDHRWDYIFGYEDHVYYVEIHPGSTGEVKVIIKKLNWLKQWRKHSATNLENIQHRSTYHWVSSGKIAITKNSKYSRILAQNGISGPNSILRVDKFL